MILVAYASPRGSTHEAADAIARTLAEEGVPVAIAPVHTVETVEPYDGVVLGVALYMGRMHGEARRFLNRFGDELAGVPLAVFGMGPRTLGQDEVAGSRRQLERGLARFPDLEPFAVDVFGGVVDPAKLRFPLNRIPASDARDWDAIRAWARTIAPTLRRVPVTL